MRNILYHYSSQQIHTGSPRVLLRLVEGLDRQMFSPCFLADHEGDLCRELRSLGTTIISGSSRSVGKGTLPRNAVNVARHMGLLRAYRIALVHLNELGWNSELALAARLSGIPVIFHIHNPERLSRRNLNCHLGARYLFVSQALAKQCDAPRVLDTRMQVLYNPINVEKFASGRSIRAELGVPADARVVGTVAQICKRKGIDIIIDVAIEILRHRPDVWFLVAGPDGGGEEDYSREMRKRVVARGLERQFIFCGSRDDINDFLASLDIFFLPTRSEPFGMVIAEAMAAGIPVVTSRVGGIPEIITDESVGLLADPENHNFPQLIETLLGDPELLQGTAERGYGQVLSRFSDTIFNSEIRGLYCSLLRWKEYDETLLATA